MINNCDVFLVFTGKKLTTWNNRLEVKEFKKWLESYEIECVTFSFETIISLNAYEFLKKNFVGEFTIFYSTSLKKYDLVSQFKHINKFLEDFNKSNWANYLNVVGVIMQRANDELYHFFYKNQINFLIDFCKEVKNDFIPLQYNIMTIIHKILYMNTINNIMNMRTHSLYYTKRNIVSFY